MLELGDKMAGLYHITTAGLKAQVRADTVVVNVELEKPALKYTTDIPTKIFFALEPKEIVEIIDRNISKKAGQPISILRTRFDGHDKNPFSSQN